MALVRGVPRDLVPVVVSLDTALSAAREARNAAHGMGQTGDARINAALSNAVRFLELAKAHCDAATEAACGQLREAPGSPSLKPSKVGTVRK